LKKDPNLRGKAMRPGVKGLYTWHGPY